MNKYLGLFIDDDQKNFESIKRLFSLKNIQLLPYENLPQDINEIYQKVIDQNVDFVIIDYDLGKQAVKYTGIDVLKNIREQDAEIYIIYLTNKDFVEDHIGEFDQTVKKKELAKEIDNVVRRLTRALSRPNNYYSKENPDDTWVYDVTTGMKPQQTQRYGDLEIVKDLTEYNASLKDALFVFQVEGTRNGEQVYSDVVSIKFNQAGKKSVLVKHLPAGTKVTVKEVYAGGSYSNTSGGTQETVIVAEGVTDNPASVSFTNTYNGKLIPGTGIVNHFENKDGEWSWEQQTDEPAIAN